MFVKKRQYTRDKIELVQIQWLSITAPGARLTAARDLFVWLPGSGKLDQLIVTEGKKKKRGKKYPPACCKPVQIVLGSGF